MKRSAGVTAAAVTLMIVGALLVFGVILLPTNPMKGSSHAVARILTLFLAFLALGIGEVVTAIAILRLRRWAWFSILVISVVYIGTGSYHLCEAPRAIQRIQKSPSYDPGSLIALQYVALVFGTIVPMALGIWWLTLFTRAEVEAQFTASTSALAPPAGKRAAE